jgi:hypothetical protein
VDNRTGVDELRKPHPDQARIDAESAHLLRASAHKSGGRGSWMPPSSVGKGPGWSLPEQLPLVKSG